MTRKLFILFALLVIAAPKILAQGKAQPAAPVMGSAYGQKLQIPGIKNAGKLNGVLYRGAQPHEQSLAQLKTLGITTIVDLREEDAARRETEKKEAESLGLKFVSIPVGGWSAPTNEQVAQFLALFRGKPDEKIFVHCHLGEDRTGVFVATYRMAIEKWRSEQALKEMYFFGFNGRWHPAMSAFVRDFPARLTTAPALANFKDPNAPAVAATQSN
ncbi:MAG TPA: tyrosine-protein phosphatase [Candidatus Dormibacteraeota bacterium]|nr:tyrosine-protein phosphatase [Candidatus Dormibacteraeota bacterium]